MKSGRAANHTVSSLMRKEARFLLREIKRISSELNRADLYPRGHVYLDKVLLGLLSKGLTIARGICVLVENDLPQEAFGLSRSLLEVALTSRYIINLPSNTQMERRATRYVHYYAKVYSEWLKRIKKHIPQHSKARNLQHEEFLAKARKYKSPYHWTLPPRSKKQRKLFGTNVAMMAREFDAHETLDGLPVQWDFDYEMIYFWTSQYVHGTAWALNSHGAAPLEPFRVHHNKGFDKALPGLALFNAAVFLFKLTVTTYRGLGHEQPKFLSRIMDLMKRLSKARDLDMRTYKAITARK